LDGYTQMNERMNRLNKIFKPTLFFLILTSGSQVFAKEFRGIVPLHSTRADVRRILGRPLFDEGKVIETFDVPEGRLNVMFVAHPCQKGLPANWGNWNVPVDTVVEISIHLEKPFRFSKLKIPNKEKKKWYTDDTLTTYYHDEKEGIEYSVTERGIVEEITYGPTSKDESLLCDRNAPKIKY